MATAKYNIVSAIKVVVIFTILIGGAYTILIPAFIPNYKTPFILVIGIVTAALINGHTGYQAPTNDILPIKIGFSLCYATVTSFLVCLLSLLIILNIRGA